MRGPASGSRARGVALSYLSCPQRMGGLSSRHPKRKKLHLRHRCETFAGLRKPKTKTIVGFPYNKDPQKKLPIISGTTISCFRKQLQRSEAPGLALPRRHGKGVVAESPMRQGRQSDEPRISPRAGLCFTLGCSPYSFIRMRIGGTIIPIQFRGEQGLKPF